MSKPRVRPQWSASADLVDEFSEYGDLDAYANTFDADAYTSPIRVGGELVAATYGGDDWAPPDMDLAEFASARPDRPSRDHYDVESQRAPLTAKQRLAEYLGAPDAETFFNMCRKKRPAGVTGGSKSGRRRTKPLKFSGSGGAPLENMADEPRFKAGSRVAGTICVHGLTLGERSIYESFFRYDLAEQVLVMLCAQIRAKVAFPTGKPTFAQAGPKTRNFFVKMNEEDHELLRHFPGAARAALVDYVHQHYGDRVRAYDAGWQSVAVADVAA